MVLPQTTTSRLTALKNARNTAAAAASRSRQQQQQAGITDYLKRSNIIPHHQQKRASLAPAAGASSSSNGSSNQKQRSKSPVLSETPQNTNSSSPAVSSNKILDGVIACLDVRTEDGDDVSQNFERALQQMGAKTRRTFGDSVTHLIFKNGSPATLKKAISKNVFIIGLLWISQCRKEGKKVSEKDYMIEKPGGLVLAGKKRRKSMEPSKVRALDSMQPSLSSGSDGSGNEGDQPESSNRRNTIAATSWKARDFNQSKERKEARNLKRDRIAFEEEELDEDPSNGIAAEIKLPRLSLPISVESIASKRNTSANKRLRTDIIPVHAPSEEKKEQIKARFSIGSKCSTSTTTSSAMEVDAPTSSNHSSNGSLLSKLNLNTPPSLLRLSSAPIISNNTTTPLKRKRRLTNNITRPVDITPSSSLENISSVTAAQVQTTPAAVIVPKTPARALTAKRTPTIVLTSVTNSVRKQCEAAIKKLGKFELASEVTEATTHVLVGAPRRTKTVTLGLLRGVWILKPDWLIKSALKNDYASEKEYELLDWYPRADLARKHIPLLPSTTHIQVISSTNGVEFIDQLVKMAGGTIVKKSEQANIIISETPIMKSDKIVVSDVWLFDSIEQWRYISTDDYIVTAEPNIIREK